MATKVQIKKILISQPQPEGVNSPYLELEKKFNVKILFRKLFTIEGVPAKEFRQERLFLKSLQNVAEKAVDAHNLPKAV